MPRFVTVNELTGKVVGVDSGNPAQVGEPPTLHRNIFEADWAITVPPQDPAIGDEWDGQDPTTFTRPVVGEGPANTQQALDSYEAAKATADAAFEVYKDMARIQ